MAQKKFREIWSDLQESGSLPFALDPSLLSSLDLHCQLLKQWNAVHNLTSVEDVTELVLDHYLDCLLALSVSGLDRVSEKAVFDLGSGNGFPGIIAATMFKDLEFSLIESSRKKCSFLKMASLKMGLKNVNVVNARVEEISRISTALTRAAFSEPFIDRLASSFHDQGRLIMMTTPHFPSAQWEPQNSPWEIETRSEYSLLSGAARSVVTLRKSRST